MNLSGLKLGVRRQKALIWPETVSQGQKVLLQPQLRADLPNQRFAMTCRKREEHVIATQKTEQRSCLSGGMRLDVLLPGVQI